MKGEPTSVRALPSIKGTKYVRLTGCNPGHMIGVRMVVVPWSPPRVWMEEVTQDMAKLEKVIPDAYTDKLSTRQSVSRCCPEFLGH